MGIEYLTVVTCDRCKRESRYDSRGDERWRSDWADLWPATVAPYGELYLYGGARDVVCADCLTDAEREQLAETRQRVQEVPPF
jgi:hypothetical protein